MSNFTQNRRRLLAFMGLTALGTKLFAANSIVPALAQPVSTVPASAAASSSAPPLAPRPTVLLVAASDAPAPLKAFSAFVCTGTNDEQKINAAMTALGPNGGTVQLTEGNFYCSGPVKMTKRIMLQGRGKATILHADGTWSAYDGTSPGAVIEAANIGISKTTVADLSIDGQRYGGANVAGIYYNIDSNADFDEGPDASNTFRDVYIYETRGHGLHLTGGRSRGSLVSRVRVYNVGSEGVDTSHGFNIDCPDGFYDHCECGSASGYGFLVAGANNRFTSCKSWYSDLTGFQVVAVRNQFSACESQDNAQHGFYITSGPNSFTACHADSNSWDGAAPTSSYDGFHIPYGSRIQLVGCSAYDKDEGGRGNWQRYGFFLGSASQHCQIIGTTKDNVSGSTSGTGIGLPENMVMVNG